MTSFALIGAGGWIQGAEALFFFIAVFGIFTDRGRSGRHLVFLKLCRLTGAGLTVGVRSVKSTSSVSSSAASEWRLGLADSCLIKSSSSSSSGVRLGTGEPALYGTSVQACWLLTLKHFRELRVSSARDLFGERLLLKGDQSAHDACMPLYYCQVSYYMDRCIVFVLGRISYICRQLGRRAMCSASCFVLLEWCSLLSWVISLLLNDEVV
mmetsp:Transcript_9160/g.27500  ORF Transcript_9160/g.27500 Transcript_9160/m.27500 type:complete len:210 (+) Transcript_9160:1542-2171(+)